jgi:hypothetical protein
MSRPALVFIIALAGCRPSAPPLPDAKPLMTLQSATFTDGQPMPAKCAADGGNVSPELHWSTPPPGTKSLSLIVEDPDAPGSSPFVHWVVFNIPDAAKSIPEGGPPAEAILGKNDAGTNAYFGPRPPSGTHHYHFRLYALDKTIDLTPGAGAGELVKEMSGHELGMGELVGLFSH